MFPYCCLHKFLDDLVLNFTFSCTILGVDEGGECAMASHKFTVDITAPEDGEILSGPYSAMVSKMFPH